MTCVLVRVEHKTFMVPQHKKIVKVKQQLFKILRRIELNCTKPYVLF